MVLAPPELRAAIGRLDEPGWPDAAAGLLAALGFRLFDGLSGSSGAPVGQAAASSGGAAAHLLVAFRDSPTLSHFDPESLSYYAPAPGGAAVRTLDLRAVQALAASGAGPLPVLWGHLHVLDRVPVENRFLTFGGELRIAPPRQGGLVADLRSHAPIVRWGGHSQAIDPIAQAIAAFFGRLMVPVDFTPGAAARLDAVTPPVLFRAFLADAAARDRRAERRGIERGPVERWVAAAWREARGDPEACDAASALLRDLGLDRDIAATNGTSAKAERPA